MLSMNSSAAVLGLNFIGDCPLSGVVLRLQTMISCACRGEEFLVSLPVGRQHFRGLSRSPIEFSLCLPVQGAVKDFFSHYVLNHRGVRFRATQQLNDVWRVAGHSG